MERSSVPLDRIDGTVESGAMPEEYGHKILDSNGDLIRISVVGRRYLAISTHAVSGMGNIDVTSPEDLIGVPIYETLRLIMQIAGIIQFCGALDEKDNEILGAIEVIARRGIQ